MIYAPCVYDDLDLHVTIPQMTTNQALVLPRQSAKLHRRDHVTYHVHHRLVKGSGF